MARHRRPRRGSTKLALTLLTLSCVSAVGGASTYAAFSSVTANEGNAFDAGTVTIGDNDTGSQMFAMSNLKPGDSDTGCIVVTYTGSLPATVRLYGTTGGTGLDQYLSLVVTRGTFGTVPAFDSCSGFTADPTDYTGAGAGVVYTGTLQGFADDYTAGLVDPTSPSPESWTNGETHVYRFQITQQDVNAAKGLTATQTFTWEARNS